MMPPDQLVRMIRGAEAIVRGRVVALTIDGARGTTFGTASIGLEVEKVFRGDWAVASRIDFTAHVVRENGPPPPPGGPYIHERSLRGPGLREFLLGRVDGAWSASLVHDVADSASDSSILAWEQQLSSPTSEDTGRARPWWRFW